MSSETRTARAIVLSRRARFVASALGVLGAGLPHVAHAQEGQVDEKPRHGLVAEGGRIPPCMTEKQAPSQQVGDAQVLLASAKALRAKGAGRLVQDALRLAGQYLEELLAGLRESLLAAYAARPDQARPLAEQIRRALNNLSFPPIVQAVCEDGSGA